MTDQAWGAEKKVSRITCAVHQQLTGRVIDCLRNLGAHTVLSYTARCVRQSMLSRAWGLPGLKVRLAEAPMETFHTTVPRPVAPQVVSELAASVDLRTPGHGSVYFQDVLEISDLEPPSLSLPGAAPEPLLDSLALLTGISSLPGSGDELAALALKMGVAVPVISVGEGTGVRDRMGLLRITIPPEKEWVHLIVPAHDVSGIMQLLIEEGRLNRPGGGFLYHTPIQMGLPDPLTRIGRQEHAATMEQLIAAMDQLKHGTAWRKRFIDEQARRSSDTRFLRRNHKEIVFICTEGRADAFIQAAICAGAPGVTTTRVRCHRFSDLEGGIAARERGVICIPAAQADRVVNALRGEDPESAGRLQILDVPAAYSYFRSGK